MERALCIDVSSLWLSASIEVKKAAAQCLKNILAAQSGVDFWEQHKNNRDPMLAYLNPFRRAKKKVSEPFLQALRVCVGRFQPSVPGQVAAVSTEESSEAREKLESQGFWTPQAGSHKSWLRALCTTLLDSGGVKSEALLLTRPLCLVRSQASHAYRLSRASFHVFWGAV